jgi:hypothetical protein
MWGAFFDAAQCMLQAEVTYVPEEKVSDSKLFRCGWSEGSIGDLPQVASSGR